MILQKLRSYFLSRQLDDVPIQDCELFLRIFVGLFDIMLNLLDEFIIRLVTCVTICTGYWMMPRLATVWVTTTGFLSYPSRVAEGLLFIERIWFLAWVCVNDTRVTAICFVSEIGWAILLVATFPRSFFHLLWSWAVPWLILGCTLWWLILIFNIYINLNRDHQWLVTLNIIWPCPSGSSFGLIFREDLAGLTLLNTAFLSWTAQMVDL